MKYVVMAAIVIVNFILGVACAGAALDAAPGTAPAGTARTGHTPVSLPTGTDLAAREGPRGAGRLTIVNDTALDAVVRLVDDATPARTRATVYVRAGERAVVTGIGPCSCRLLFTLGRDWDAAARRFAGDRSYSEFDDRLEFEERRTPAGVEYATFEVTLHPVAGGNASTSAIDEGQFLGR